MGKAGNAIALPYIVKAWDGKQSGGGFEIPLSLNPADQNAVVGSYISVLVNIQMKLGATVYPDKVGGYAWAAVPVSLNGKRARSMFIRSTSPMVPEKLTPWIRELTGMQAKTLPRRNPSWAV